MNPDEYRMLARISASISDLLDGGVTAAAIENEIDTRTREHLLAEEERLLRLEKSLRAHLSRTTNRADKAEAERDWNLRSSRRAKEQRIKANARADQAEARIQAVRELHVASGPSGVICDACNVVTPCPTIRVLDSDGDPGQSCGRGPCALGYGHPGACRC